MVLTRKGIEGLLFFYKEKMDLGSPLCWKTIHTLGEVLISLFDVGLFSSKETLCLLLLQGVDDSWIRSVLTVGSYAAL